VRNGETETIGKEIFCEFETIFYLESETWVSADFFPGGQESTFCLKNNKKDNIFSKKV
jgi:hypothetical protein